jgi:hypothetical protein
MKKYFATAVIAATMFSISLVSCTKDVSGTSGTSKANSASVSNISKIGIGWIGSNPDSTATTKTITKP